MPGSLFSIPTMPSCPVTPSNIQAPTCLLFPNLPYCPATTTYLTDLQGQDRIQEGGGVKTV